MEETSKKGEWEMNFSCVVQQSCTLNFKFSPHGQQEISEGIKKMGHGDEPTFTTRVECGRDEETVDSPLSHR